MKTKSTVPEAIVFLFAHLYMYNISSYIMLTEESSTDTLMSVKMSIAKIIIGIVALFFTHYFTNVSIKRLLFSCNPLPTATIISIVAILWLTITLITKSSVSFTTSQWISFTLGNLAIGIFEEFVSRIGVLWILLKKWHRNQKDLFKVCLVSGFMFGIAHLPNLFNGNEVKNVIIQVITASFIGTLLGIIYLRTFNIWCCVLIHAFYDYTVFLTRYSKYQSFKLPSDASTQTLSLNNFGFIIISILIFVGLFALSFVILQKLLNKSASKKILSKVNTFLRNTK